MWRLRDAEQTARLLLQAPCNPARLFRSLRVAGTARRNGPQLLLVCYKYRPKETSPIPAIRLRSVFSRRHRHPLRQLRHLDLGLPVNSASAARHTAQAGTSLRQAVHLRHQRGRRLACRQVLRVHCPLQTAARGSRPTRSAICFMPTRLHLWQSWRTLRPGTCCFRVVLVPPRHGARFR